MAKILLALVLLSSAMLIDPTRMLGYTTNPQAQFVGQKLKGTFDIDRVLPGLRRSSHR